jgi:hypothetical protein
MITVTPQGVPSISNVVLSGKTVSCTYNPQGKAMIGYQVIGISSSPKVSDQIVIQGTSTSSDVISYRTSTSTPVNIVFPAFLMTNNLAGAAIIIFIEDGAVVYNTMVGN